MLGLRFCARAFSSCGERGPLFIAVRGPLTIAASLVAEHRLQMRRLSNCASRAQLLRGMWDPPRPGLEPMSPALAGRFSTTVPPGKPSCVVFVQSLPAHHCLELFIYCPLSDLYVYMNSVAFSEPQVKMIRIMNFTIWYLALRDQGCICFEEGFLKQPLASLNKLDERWPKCGPGTGVSQSPVNSRRIPDLLNREL